MVPNPDVPSGFDGSACGLTSCCGPQSPTPAQELADRLATALWTGEWNYLVTRLSWMDKKQIINALRFPDTKIVNR